MLLAEKPRGSDDKPFPAAGMSGTEIKIWAIAASRNARSRSTALS